MWCKNEIEGHNYKTEIASSYAEHCRLSHGYDDTKPNEEIDLEDLKNASRFRGGKCGATAFEKGDIYAELDWECAEGHVFKSSPFTVLKAGHWCPYCIREGHWNFGLLAKRNPFYSQVWYDSHKKNENEAYWFDSDHNERREVAR